MRNYEFTVIFVADEERKNAGLEAVTGALAAAGAEITKQDDMGVKFFAYEIQKQDKGHYVYFELAVDPAKIVEFEQAFRLNHNIMKFLFVHKADK
ncbi:MAG: 30S ribosomal protein S6 [Spirochaetales bacterium]|nr:30S ribosomal protein S6 [Spirochaetales bacterium]